MTNLNEIKQKMLGYVAVLEEAEKRIPDFQKRASAFVEQQERRREIRDRIEQLGEKIAPKEAELAGLKRPYLDSIFNQAVNEQRRIQQTKKRLENEIKAIEKAIEDEQKKLDAEPVDTEAAAELKAALDGFGLPASWTFTSDMKTEVEIPLMDAVRELQGRVDSIGRTLRGIDHDQEQYEAYRLENDQAYRAQKEASRRARVPDERRVKEWRRIEERNAREEAIAAGPSADRVGATVRDARLGDDLDD